MEKFKTRIFIIKGEDICADLASLLVHQSCWFEVMPLPDDYWEFTTKPEMDLKKFAVVEKEL